MKFAEIKFKTREDGLRGTLAAVFFPNGYGASIITGPAFHTSRAAPYELAVLEGDETEAYITYDTPITGDVIGYLTATEVEAKLAEIEALPPSK